MNETKHCNGCDRDLPKGSFRRRPDVKDGVRSRCRQCEERSRKGQKNARKRALKRQAIEYKGGKCQNPSCPIPEDFEIPDAAFEFHHRDPTEKEFGIGYHRNKSWDKLKTELDKCDLLCCLCHRMKETGD